ncbi:MAG: hypothetical protein LBP35_01170 [Candidatus Ancillula trichonymphae]|nr:hypothetical protein [Candidatus Ancillula trichonymphae]
MGRQRRFTKLEPATTDYRIYARSKAADKYKAGTIASLGKATTQAEPEPEP